MSDTIPDITLGTTEYVDLNTLTGIAAGTALVVFNKGIAPIRLQKAAAQPADNSTEGEVIGHRLHARSFLILDAGESTLWGKSAGVVDATISLQDNS